MTDQQPKLEKQGYRIDTGQYEKSRKKILVRSTIFAFHPLLCRIHSVVGNG